MAGKGQGSGLKGIIAGIVLVVALFLLLNMQFHWVDLKFFGGAENPAVQRDLRVLAIDIDTGETVWVTQKPKDTFPMKNSAGKETLYKAYVSYDAEILFPARPGVMIQTCPRSGSQKTGSAEEEHEGYEVVIPPGFPEQ